MLVEEAGDIFWRDVSPGFEETLCKNGNGVCVCGDEFSENVCELDFVFEGGDGAASGGLLPVWKEDGERMEVVVIYSRDVGVGDNDIREVAQGLDTAGEADREQREGEVGGGEEGSL